MVLCGKGEITLKSGQLLRRGRQSARFTPAGDLKPVECIHSVLGILEAKASQG